MLLIGCSAGLGLLLEWGPNTRPPALNLQQTQPLLRFAWGRGLVCIGRLVPSKHKHMDSTMLAGSSAGTGNAARFWDEFKPHKRTNKRSQARDASTASFSSASSIDEAGSTDGDGRAAESSVDAGGSVSDVDRWAGMPVAGVVCEYPLSQVVMDELQDGRTHGVGLLLGRNCDR